MPEPVKTTTAPAPNKTSPRNPKPPKMMSAEELADSVTPEEYAASAPNTAIAVTVGAVVEEREVIYPDFIAVRCKDPSYEGATDFDAPPMTYDQAMALLGWTIEQKGEKWGADYLLLDGDGNKVRCLNNMDNRKFSLPWAETLCQDHLRKKFRLNGETVTIGRTGRIISAQHRLIGLILAYQEWLKNPDHYPEWPEGPTLSCLVVYGVSEDEETLQTVDNVRPRTLSDVFYTSSMFKHDSRGVVIPTADREAMSKMAADGIRFLWERTRAKENPWKPLYRSHSESRDFLVRHRRLVEALHHIHTENQGKKKVAEYAKNLGIASGLMYLMAAGKSDIAAYTADDERRETNLDLTLWDAAQDFWVLLNGEDPEFKPMLDAIKALPGEDGSHVPKIDENLGLIAKGWLLYVNGEKMVKNDPRLALDYVQDDETKDWTLNEWPTVGGIDLGAEKSGAKLELGATTPEGEPVNDLEGTDGPAADAEAQAAPEPRKKPIKATKPDSPLPVPASIPKPIVPALAATEAAKKAAAAPIPTPVKPAPFQLSAEDQKVLASRQAKAAAANGDKAPVEAPPAQTMSKPKGAKAAKPAATDAKPTTPAKPASAKKAPAGKK